MKMANTFFFSFFEILLLELNQCRETCIYIYIVKILKYFIKNILLNLKDLFENIIQKNFLKKKFTFKIKV